MLLTRGEIPGLVQCPKTSQNLPEWLVLGKKIPVLLSTSKAQGKREHRVSPLPGMAKRKLFTTEGLSDLNRVVVKEGVGATRGDGLKINFLITWNIDPGVSDGSALSFLSRGYWATSIPKFCEKMGHEARTGTF